MANKDPISPDPIIAISFEVCLIIKACRMVRFEGKCTKIKFSPGYDCHQPQKHAIIYKWIKGGEDPRLNNSLSFFFKKKSF
jgi:hypothetical protein